MKKLFSILAVLMLTVSLYGQSDKDKISYNNEETQAVNNVLLAQQLANYGYANNDPMSLLAAAKIVSKTKLEVLKADKVESKGTEPKETKPGVFANLMDVEKLKKDAKEMSKGDKAIVAMADQITPDKGATYGAVTYYDRVNAYGTDVHTCTFTGGELAIFTVDGDGDTDIDLYVYDSYGDLVGQDIDNTDACVVMWIPSYTQQYRFKIVNRGSVYNDYVIITN